MAGHRCGKLVKQERHSWIIEAMARGVPRPQLVREVRQRWNISQSQAVRCLADADAERAQIYSHADRAGMLSKCLEAAEKALELAQEHKNVHEIARAVALLDGLLALGASHERRNRPWENR